MATLPKVRIEVSGADQVVADLHLLSRQASTSIELADRLRNFRELRGDMLCVHAESAPVHRAGTAFVVLQLPEPLLELVAAVRTGEFGVCVPEIPPCEAHGPHRPAGTGAATAARRGRGLMYP